MTVADSNTPDDEKDPQFAYTLARGLEVLRAFDAASPVLSNREISQRIGIARPTVARLTRTLALLGYLRYNEASARYRFDASILSFAYPLLSQLSVRRIAHQPMQQLADYARGAVSLAMRSRLQMVIVDSCIDPSALTGKPDIGATRELGSTALGLAYCSSVAPAERAQIHEALRKADESSWPSLESRLQQAQAQFDAHGYCTALSASVGIQAVAVPVRCTVGEEMLVMNCAVAPFNLAPDALEKQIAPRLLHLARDIETAQGLR